MDGHIAVELAVIGFGKGGKTLAGAFAAAGRQVAIVEQSAAMYGGTCINIGCVPTKALIHAAENPDRSMSDEDWFRASATRTQMLTATMRAKNFEIFDSPDTARVITGRAEFEDPHTLLVTAGDDELRLRAETIVINTGAEPVLPPLPGLRESARVVTSTGALALAERPEHLIVLGGGYVGVEFASMHAAFGTRVTLVHRGERVLPAEDPSTSAEVEQLLADAGVAVRTNTTVTAVEDDDEGVRVIARAADGATVEIAGDRVLAALGRRPVTAGLGLERVGIAVGERGEVVVDDRLRTGLEHVYAVGDVHGGPQFTYLSLDDFRIVRDQLLGAGTRRVSDRVAVPTVVFTTPPLARVGLTESAARAAGRAVRTSTRRIAEMATVPRAKMTDARGVMSAVVDAETDELLGLTMLGHDSHEVINAVAVGMRLGATASQLRDGIYTHPSMTEALNDVLAHLN
ncbi:FAD-dependent oxidoreductase [Microbacterium sp. H1-D42]|uniref:FAD-dependent oxidoreductase n=1 Tax=Microbacterium sp. H1-D42 TaxID=2925844 RepID=UPI001F53B0D9|nr:FAD-dependent oxidoreductase [Microbacterium sp. H1-D42]UNK69746.1 FAD-dependent oxidoreductase [Microbacterium sp. H1-D42]